MVYVPNAPWQDLPSTATPITAAKLDHIETQYAEAVAQIVAANGLNVKDFGAIGDGVHDDTVAIQAAIDAAVAGQTIFFPPSGSTNEFYRITSGLLVTTPSLQFRGVPRDAYSVSIRCNVAGVTMLTVKAGGFVMRDLGFFGVESIPAGGVNGAGANVNGIDLFGTINGDVDSELRGVTFQYVSVAARVRGRNSLFDDLCLFNNVLDGIVFQGIDPSYHLPTADNNRGNTVRNCRFHNVGTSAANNAIAFTNTARVIHAIVEGNFFDSNGIGTHIRALGGSIAADNHQRISCNGNVHTELASRAYDFQYVNNFSIMNARVYGYVVSGSLEAIRIQNAVNFYIADAYLYQMPGTGIIVRNSSRFSIVGVRAMNLGLSGSVAHGLDIDSSCSEVSIRDVFVRDTTGWGFIGEPTASSMTGCQFLVCTLGALNSLTLNNFTSNGLNWSVEGRFGRVEDTGIKPFDFAAGVSKAVATVACGTNFGSTFVDVEFTARDGVTGSCYVFAKRVFRPENGTPIFTTIGTDATATATVSFTGLTPTSMVIGITTTSAVFGTVKVRASAPGSAGATNARNVTVTMG